MLFMHQTPNKKIKKRKSKTVCAVFAYAEYTLFMIFTCAYMHAPTTQLNLEKLRVYFNFLIF